MTKTRIETENENMEATIKKMEFGKIGKCPFCNRKMYYTGCRATTQMDWKCQNKNCIIYSHKDDTNEPMIW